MEAMAFEAPVFEEFASEFRVVSVRDRSKPFGEAETDVFDAPEATFAGNSEPSEAVRTFVCNPDPSSACRALPVVINETARRTHQACFIYERRREKSMHFSRFFTAKPPPPRRECPCKTGTNAHCFGTHKRQPQPLKNSAVEKCLCAFSSLHSSATLYEKRSQLLHVRLSVGQR